MISRRSTLGLIASAPLLPVTSLSYAQGDDIGTIGEQIRLWRDDPANSSFFEVPAPGEAKGTLILAPEDPRVIEAARLLAGLPRNRPPIEIARSMLKALPENSRMEWPRDTPGAKRPANPIIVAFFAATQTIPFSGDQTAWCSAFACWTMQRAGLDHPRSAGSRSFRSWGQKTNDPQVGDIVVYQNKSDPVFGHVAFFDGFADANKTKVWLIGGNQSDQLNRDDWAIETNSLKLHSFRTGPGLRT
ncbi:CHAP domain-containing protein [Microvirga terrae]|uniref:CHAP domain-containing protein n=1 Tax=Microvirga terrae TaxID=2740529 RepID=A0ABY5RPC9_9HYPH|nr:CHAP domain-containing protein [Microvirga terrae]UVF18833.1 CHAP domain-containing protein [Microvirga terrae]